MAVGPLCLSLHQVHLSDSHICAIKNSAVPLFRQACAGITSPVPQGRAKYRKTDFLVKRQGHTAFEAGALGVCACNTKGEVGL